MAEEETYTTFDPEDLGKDTSYLSQQNLETLDITRLHPLSPEVISRQATINIGTIGHVAHGKSTVVKAISGVQTVRFTNELERNITIKLGYANAKIFKCSNPSCPRPDCYQVCLHPLHLLSLRFCLASAFLLAGFRLTQPRFFFFFSFLSPVLWKRERR